MLSERQHAVLPLLSLGKTNEEIGTLLGVSALTIKAHVSAILRKLNAPNRVAAVWTAMRKGYIEPPPLDVAAPPRPPRPINQAPIPAPLPEPKWITYKQISLCWETMEAEINGQPVPISPVMFRLLHFLITNPRRPHNRQVLLDNIFSTDRAYEERVVDVHIRRLRSFLAGYGLAHYVQTAPFLGYKLQ